MCSHYQQRCCHLGLSPVHLQRAHMGSTNKLLCVGTSLATLTHSACESSIRPAQQPSGLSSCELTQSRLRALKSSREQMPSRWQQACANCSHFCICDHFHCLLKSDVRQHSTPNQFCCWITCKLLARIDALLFDYTHLQNIKISFKAINVTLLFS
jgi:hypothetical protein